MSGNQLADDLRAARALIDTPETWAQRAPGFVRHGVNGPIYARCLYIAITERWGSRLAAQTAVAASLPWWWRLLMRWRGAGRAEAIIWFNDRRRTRHHHILALFDRAISAALSEPHK